MTTTPTPTNAADGRPVQSRPAAGAPGTSLRGHCGAGTEAAASGAPGPSVGRWPVGPRALGATAAAGGVAWVVSAALLAADPDGVRSDELTTTAAHVAVGAMALALVLTAAGVLLLARSVPASRGPWAVIAGQLLLAGASTTTNVRGEDPSWFAAAAVPANALWLLGSIAAAVALRRAGVARPVAVGLPLVWVGAIPLSVAGCAALSGAYWIAVGLGAVVAVRPRPAAVAPAA